MRRCRSFRLMMVIAFIVLLAAAELAAIPGT